MFPNTNTVEITKSILHVLDTRASHSISLSDALLDIKSNAVFSDFLKLHTKASLRSKRRKSGRFRDAASGLNLVYEHIKLILNNPTDSHIFIEESKKIAQLLYTIMKAKGNIRESDILINLYKNDVDEYFIGIMMLEFANNVFHSINATAAGTEIALTSDIISLPTSNNGVRRCAYLTIEHDATHYSIISDEKTMTTQYFYTEFLDAIALLNDNDKTKKVYEILTDKCYNALDAYDDIIGNLVDQLSTQHTFNILDFIHDQILDPVISDELLMDLHREGIIEEEIEINREYVNSTLKYEVIRFDNGISIKIPLAIRNSESIQLNVNSDDGLVDCRFSNTRFSKTNLTSR